MTANELRIGNWVLNASSKTPVQVDSICNKGISLFADCCVTGGELEVIYSFNDLEPIPLTEEILEKCGFEKDEPKGWYRKGFMDLFDGNPFHYASGNNLCPDILYLHQLQNLYFALTGEELNINL